MKKNVIQMSNAEFLPHVCELVNQGHKVSIRAKGNSMRPFLESGRDIAVLSRIGTPKVGDVVLAEIAKGKYVLHRIDKIHGNSITLRGDGNIKGTEQCRTEDIRAIANEFIRKGKTWHKSCRLWKIYSWLWPRLLPLRRILLALYRLLWLGELPNRFKRK
jgi:hypothetical protein